MAKGLQNWLTKPNKFGARDEILHANDRERMSGTPEDFKELEKRVRSILVTVGKPCHVSEIEKEYKLIFGRKFPVCELGSFNAVDVLKKIPEACEICDESQADPLISVKLSHKNAHIFELVKKSKAKSKSSPQQSVPLKDVFVPFTVQDGIRSMLYERKRIRKNEFYKMLENRFDLKSMNLEVSVETLVRSLPHILHNDGVFVKSAYKIQKCEIEIPEYLHFEDELVVPSYRLSNLELQISRNLHALLVERRYMQVMDIPRYYIKKFGKELNWQQFGFQDLWRFLQLLPGNFGLLQLDSGYVIAAPEIDVSGAVDVRELDEKKFCGRDVYCQVLEKIRQLVLHASSGLNRTHIESSYEAMYYEKFVIKTDLYSYLRKLHDRNIFSLKETEDKVMLFPCNIDEIQKIEQIKQEKIEQFFAPQCPVDVLKSGDALKLVNFQEVINANNQQFCSARVSFIETPNNFCIQVMGVGIHHQNELYNQFICLSKDMQEFYATCSEEYNISVTNLKLDMICAGCVKGEWQRVIILDMANNARILVRSVDYGECHELLITNLKYLKQVFSILPVLAYKCTVFNIRPTASDWSTEAILEFRRLTIRNGVIPKALSVLIIHRNNEGLLQVALIDVSQDDEIHIGDILINLGYAAFKFEEQALSALYC